MINIRILIFALAFNCGASVAENARWAIDINLTSQHPGAKKDTNENNFGLGLEFHQNKIVYFAGGYYENSRKSTAKYIGLGLKAVDAKYFMLGVEGGYLDGYDFKYNAYGAVVIAIGSEHHKLKINYAPTSRIGFDYDIVGVQYQGRF